MNLVMAEYDRMKFFVFDVESIGLYGDPFAVGWIAFEWVKGEVWDASKWFSLKTRFVCERGALVGLEEGRRWVEQNWEPLGIEPTHKDLGSMIDDFRNIWMMFRQRGFLMAAECPFPCETQFLRLMTLTTPGSGPYPLIDIASVRLAKGLNPLGIEPRREEELPIHDPLSDAIQSGRLLWGALNL